MSADDHSMVRAAEKFRYARFTAVRFVLDYVTLQFGPGCFLTALIWPEIEEQSCRLEYGQRAYRNTLCMQLDHVVTAIDICAQSELCLTFDTNVRLRVFFAGRTQGEHVIIQAPDNFFSVF
jgi:hypothetical protein